MAGPVIGTLIRAPDGTDVARIMATLEVVLRVGPASDLAGARALVDALLAGYAGALRSASDNRDLFALRPAEPGELAARVGAALAVACGAEQDPSAADWATMTHYDVADPTEVPKLAAGCALGRRIGEAGEAGVALTLALAEGDPWPTLDGLADRLAAGWPGLWRWVTVGYRLCPLDYRGFHLAHPAIRRVAPRYRTADVGDTLGLHTSHWTLGLRTVARVTRVAPDLAARCEPALRSPTTAVDVEPLAGGGACVRVREPAPGHAGGDERGYVEAAHLLRPAHAPADAVAFLPPWDPDSTLAWLRRWAALDGAGVAPGGPG